jgi:CDP-diacylglycerol--glycerol-3-phosphate 3-phosphatidyltransferase
VTPEAGLWNVANVLTIVRILLVPVFVGFLLAGGTAWRLAALGTFCVASLTDVLDGRLARSRGLVTDFGKIADPVADKALTGAALICLSALGELPWWVTGLIMFRELGVTGLRFWVIRQGVIAASRGGKAKTLLQIIAICLYLLPASLSPPALVRELFMAAAVVATVVTGADYVLQAMRRKLPFGIAQIGRSFRNEITPGNFIFRTREFEQMELEFFVNPLDTVGGQPADEYWHEHWIEARMAWYQRYGIRPENLRIREHAKEELAHYAKRTVDIEYQFAIGWSELEGIANRTDFDLKRHAEVSGRTLSYFDEERKQHVVPYVIEPAAGVDRTVLAILTDAYHVEDVRGEKRVVLRFHPEVAPVKIAVLPLLKKREEIVTRCWELRDRLAARGWVTVYDDTAAIGRLYRRQDEVGTPYCVTVDVQTVGDAEKGETGDGRVTIRDRDSMGQIRVPIAELETAFADLLGGTPWAAVAARYPAQAATS